MNLDEIYKEGLEIYPPKEQVYRAIELCPINKTKVVILGQDPYHGKNQANGLSFSVNKGIKVPPSLQNIYKELKNDLKIEPPNHGDLTYWAKQGVLLLNSILTVEKGKPMSHEGLGWQNVTDSIIKCINDDLDGVVFILWGKRAQEKKQLITNKTHLILESNHPSPYSSYGFFGTKPFSKANNFLWLNGKETIDWKLK